MVWKSTNMKILDIFWIFKSNLQSIYTPTSIHCLFLTLINVFLCVKYHTFISVSTIFSLCSYFHLFFGFFLPQDTFYYLQCLIQVHNNLPIILHRWEKYFIAHNERKSVTLIITKTNAVILLYVKKYEFFLLYYSHSYSHIILWQKSLLIILPIFHTEIITGIHQNKKRSCFIKILF